MKSSLWKCIIFAAVILYGCSDRNEGRGGSIQFGNTLVELPYTEGVYTIEYSTDDDFACAGDIKVVCGDSWISATDLDTPGIIELGYSYNDSGCARESIVEVIYGSATAYIEVHQASEFGIEITACNDYNMTYKVTPPDEESTYLHGVMDLSTYQRFSSDSYFIDYVIGKLEEEAGAAQVPFEEFLLDHTGTGIAEYAYYGMECSSDYIVYCCALNDDMTLAGNMSRAEFSSGAEVSINLSVESDGPMAYVSALPTYDDRQYYFGVLSAYECNDNPANIEKVIMDIIQTEVEYYSWAEGISVAEYVENITTTGPDTKKMELLDEYEYYALALCLNSEAELVSDVFSQKFKTGAVHPSDNVIKIEISNLTNKGCDYSLTTTNDDPYLFFIDVAQNWADCSDEDLMTQISAMYPTTTYGWTGNASGTVTSLEPDTEYIAFAFGSIACRPTTELTKVYFTTLGN